jgi:4-coumarate--CoA ligase
MIFLATTKYDLRSLKILFSGAAPLGSTLVNAVRSKMKSVGAECDVSQGQSDIIVPSASLTPSVFVSAGYGLTETSPTTHVLPAKDCLRKVGSIGVLLPNLEARLVVDDISLADGTTGRDAKLGESGELWIRGPNVMKVRCYICYILCFQPGHALP